MCLSRSEAEGKCFIELRKIDWCIADMTAITERKSAMKKAADASHGARLRFWVFARIATVAEITEAYVSGELENFRVVVDSGFHMKPQTYDHTNEVVFIVSRIDPCVDIVIWICSDGFDAAVKIVPRAIKHVFDMVHIVSSFLISVTLV